MAQSLWQGWETVGLIGKGSFGSVYEIRRTILDETERAALKVITVPQSANELEELYSDGYDQQSVARFYDQHLRAILSEYTTMRKLSSCENVVTCQDVHYTQHDDGIGWDIFIKMELLTPLHKAFPTGMSEQLILQLGMDICRALQVCKAQGVLHRDIKPQNIFFSNDGRFKLGDFGVAKAVEKTTGGTKIGTYKYMAPEVFNNQPYGTAADIYSLGLVLYWLLNEHRMPFLPLPPAVPGYSDEENAKLRRFRGEPIPPPRNGSAALKAVVLKACAYDPKDRFSGAGEMLTALEQTQASPAAPPQEPEQTIRVRTIPAQPSEPLPPVREEPAAKPAPAKKGQPWGWLVALLAVLALSICITIITNRVTEPPATESGAQQASRPQLTTADPYEGLILQFGMYEQDNDLSGQEPVNWQVLQIRDGKALVISQHVLDCQPYDTNGGTDWDSCDLRTWLNRDFLDTAFTEEEQQRIVGSPDKLFLLTPEEIETLLPDPVTRLSGATAYACSNGVWKSFTESSWWWLQAQDRQVAINDDGSIFTVTGGSESVGVRPAMWIRIDESLSQVS